MSLTKHFLHALEKLPCPILFKPCILGIDIAKKTFQCALLKGGKFKHKAFSNNPRGHVALSQWLGKQGVTTAHACLEATGIYGEDLAYYLADASFTVSIVHPAKIKGFAQCQLQRLKTDQAEAKLIAQYCAAMRPKLWNPPYACPTPASFGQAFGAIRQRLESGAKPPESCLYSSATFYLRND